ncbi:uncharacterized protein LOC114828040 [Galendromus occidentalis]|uniref:Uncharacterized protein LOC114828040 n=1 Tax=Galendromus occidentalis TaxID=34638 RepID=A0AAJ7SD09_9ACAR|nr:uncharacterized protein LOC114828040 [Galendromus occidentalis]
MFRIVEKDGDTHIFSVVSKTLLCVIRDNRKAKKNGLTYVDTQIVSVHDSIRRREASRQKAELLAKKNEFPIHLPPETAPLITKNYYMSGFGLQAAKSRTQRGQTQAVQQQQEIPTNRDSPEEMTSCSKSFLEDVPFSSNLGRRFLRDRQCITNYSELPRYERYINRKFGPPLDCITYPYVYRGSEYPQPTPLRTYLFGKRPKGEYVTVKRKRPNQRYSRRS